jgi:hypothetical protein
VSVFVPSEVIISGTRKLIADIGLFGRQISVTLCQDVVWLQDCLLLIRQ